LIGDLERLLATGERSALTLKPVVKIPTCYLFGETFLDTAILATSLRCRYSPNFFTNLVSS